MRYRAIVVSRHAVGMAIARFEEWVALPDVAIMNRLSALIRAGVPVGAQMGNGLAIECQTETGSLYAVGQVQDGVFIVATILTREQLAANMGRAKLRPPELRLAKTRNGRHARRSRRKALQQEKPWRIDGHFEPETLTRNPRPYVRPTSAVAPDQWH